MIERQQMTPYGRVENFTDPVNRASLHPKTTVKFFITEFDVLRAYELPQLLEEILGNQPQDSLCGPIEMQTGPNSAGS
jgi:hypothetical protein